jgi:hypothetical protein
MPFGALFSGDLYCMPSSFGDRHALQAWGTCNPATEQYSIGQPKAVPQVCALPAAPAVVSGAWCCWQLIRAAAQASLKQTKKGLNNAMSGNGWGFSQPLEVM